MVIQQVQETHFEKHCFRSQPVVNTEKQVEPNWKAIMETHDEIRCGHG